MARPWRAAHIATSPSHLAPSRDLKSQQRETSNKMWHKDWVSPVLRDEDLLAVPHGLSSPTVLNWQLREQDRSHCCALWWQWSYKYIFGTKIGIIHQSYFWWPQNKVSFWVFSLCFLAGLLSSPAEQEVGWGAVWVTRVIRSMEKAVWVHSVKVQSTILKLLQFLFLGQGCCSCQGDLSLLLLFL